MSFLCALWVGRGCRSPEHGFVSPLLVQNSRHPPWGKDLEQFGTLRPRRTCSWPKAACSRFGIASPILWCCYLRKWIFPAVLGGWAWSLPFLLGICLWETSGEEAEMTTPILQTGKLRPSHHGMKLLLQKVRQRGTRKVRGPRRSSAQKLPQVLEPEPPSLLH